MRVFISGYDKLAVSNMFRKVWALLLIDQIDVEALVWFVSSFVNFCNVFCFLFFIVLLVLSP